VPVAIAKKNRSARAAKPAKKQRVAKKRLAKGVLERDELLAQYWQHPDENTLRVWADSLIERGDPRGEYVQMCLLEKPTDQQRAIREAFEKQHHTRLAGPVRPFLREFHLGSNGLVERARCEADLLVAGLPLIEQLNPQLALSVTSLDAKRAGLAACSLERIYHVNFGWGVIGSQSGSNMKDETLVEIAPALRRVRHLSLQCTGYRDKCFTPAALRVLGETVECLEYLGFTYFCTTTTWGSQPALAPLVRANRGALAPFAEYANVIATAPGFRTLKVVFMRGLADPAILSTLPRLVHAETLAQDQPGAWKNTSSYGGNYGVPGTADEIEPLKRGRATS
jgi:uncharacterized protein (TIGR02996 family)